jgi:hypothetical protein
MKAPAPDEADATLSVLLKEAHPNPSLPPRFQEGVWARLARLEAGSTARKEAGWFEQLIAGLLRPAYASVGMASVMFLGAWLGVRDGAQSANQLEQARYVAAVSPFHRPAP